MNKVSHKIPPEAFAVKWTGDILIKQLGTYTFYTTSFDGSRVFVDNQLIVDNSGVSAVCVTGVQGDSVFGNLALSTAVLRGTRQPRFAALSRFLLGCARVDHLTTRHATKSNLLYRTYSSKQFVCKYVDIFKEQKWNMLVSC